MSDATSFSKLGYARLKKESAAGTAVFPTTYFELLSESMLPNWDLTEVNAIAGNRSVRNRAVKDKVGPFNGQLEVYVEPNTVGHFMLGLFGEDTHTEISAAVSEQSDFQPLNTLVTFTLDIKVAGENYVTRYFGVRIAKAVFSLDGNKLKVSLDVTAQRVFTNARLTVAHASGTALDLDQTSGLTTSDTLIILDDAAPDTSLAELTISSITSEILLVSSAIGASLGVGDIVVIKAQTPDDEDFDLSNEFIWSGGAEVYAAAGANAMQALAAKTNCESMELTIENEIEPRWAATGVDVVDRMPSAMLVKGVKVSGKFSQFHTNPEFMDMLREMEQLGLRFRFLGNVLQANSAVAAAATLESTGAGTVTVTADDAGEAGNDYAIKVVQGTTTLSVSLSGKLITVTLDVDAADNAVATVATAIAALSGVGATSSGSGNVSVVDNPDKVEFSGGRDASEREMLRFDLPNVRLMPFHPNISAEEVVQEDIEFSAFRDSNDGREIKVRLRNDTTAY